MYKIEKYSEHPFSHRQPYSRQPVAGSIPSATPFTSPSLALLKQIPDNISFYTSVFQYVSFT